MPFTAIHTLDAYGETAALGNCPVPASYRWVMVPLESLEIEIVAVQPDQLIAVDRVALDTLDDDYSVVGLLNHKLRRDNRFRYTNHVN